MDKTAMAINVFSRHAKAYQDKFMDVSLYHDTLDLFCSSIAKANAAILELACGPGNISRYLLNKRPDFQLLGTDLSAPMLELARINNPEATFAIMDCRHIDKLEGSYDGIMAGFVLPYLSKEEAIQLITDARRLLKPAGMLYLSTMEDDYSKSGLETSPSGNQIFIHYHQADYLVHALEENNLLVVDLQRKIYPGSDGKTVTDLIVIAKLS
jgi:2-polyprenyl-3-methyl-5-hydroxy-6-metoxy-1,4-benzoquinol methylase